VELGAMAIAGIFYFSLFMLGFGFSTGGQILIARRCGERNFKDVGRIFDHSLYFLFALAVIIFFIVKLFSPIFMHRFVSSPAIAEASIAFLNYRIWGVFFAFLSGLFRAFYVGIARTKMLFWAAVIMALVNILLAWLLIFGKWGFPQMGIAGAGLAASIAEAVSALFMIAITIRKYNLVKYRIFRFDQLDLGVIKKTLEISIFIMLQYFVSLGGWFTFFMIIEKMGEHELAISNIVRSAYMVLMLPIWAFSSAANTLVSNAIGAGKSDFVMPIIRKVSTISFLTILAIVVLSVIFPHAILRVYTNDEALIASTMPSLYVISGALLLFSISQIIFSGVSGTANTNVAMGIEFITIFIYLVYVYLVALVFRKSIELVWTSEYIYFIIMGVLSVLYMRFGKWRSKVI
jgi:putative MATE family efflux protein